MTDICLKKEKNFTELVVMGHCNAGRINGHDLCCCGVSMLVFTLLEALKSYRLKGFSSSYGGGWCHVKFQNGGKDYKKGVTTLDAIMKGFGLLKEKYPSNIQINSNESEVQSND